jgi:hypothetical protein
MYTKLEGLGININTGRIQKLKLGEQEDPEAEDTEKPAIE